MGKMTKEELRIKVEEMTSDKVVNLLYEKGLSEGRIKGRFVKEGWKKNIARFHLNHFNSSEERCKVLMMLILSLLTEEELEGFPF